MPANDLSHYRSRGARAIVVLHENQLRDFLAVLKRAKAANIKLPETGDSDYQSLEHLLTHGLRAARGYMTWTCDKLGLPDPEIRPTPPPDKIEAEADQYLEHLIERWRVPLADIPGERFEETFRSRWKTIFSIEAMLEHAIVHPMRHAFQLRELMSAQEKMKNAK